MNFKEASEKENFFLNKEQLFECHDRKKLWDRCFRNIESLLKDLYFLYEVKSFYFVNNFIKKDIALAEQVEILFDFGKEDFEDLVDSHVLEQYSEGVKYYCRVNQDVFVLEDSSWRKYDAKISYSIISE